MKLKDVKIGQYFKLGEASFIKTNVQVVDCFQCCCIKSGNIGLECFINSGFIYYMKNEDEIISLNDYTLYLM